MRGCVKQHAHRSDTPGYSEYEVLSNYSKTHHVLAEVESPDCTCRQLPVAAQ